METRRRSFHPHFTLSAHLHLSEPDQQKLKDNMSHIQVAPSDRDASRDKAANSLINISLSKVMTYDTATGLLPTSYASVVYEHIRQKASFIQPLVRVKDFVRESLTGLKFYKQDTEGPYHIRGFLTTRVYLVGHSASPSHAECGRLYVTTYVTDTTAAATSPSPASKGYGVLRCATGNSALPTPGERGLALDLFLIEEVLYYALPRG